MTPEDLTAAADWLVSRDTGTSSTVLLAAAMAGKPPVTKAYGLAFPHDAWDFGRCVRLIEAAPGVREAAFPVLAQHPGWKELIPAWDELTKLWNLNHQWNPVSDRINELLQS